MKVTMLLADYAKVSDGKLDVLGGGWSVIGPQVGPAAIALYIQVPWDKANTRHRLRLELLDSDGHPVLSDSTEGEQPVGLIQGEFEVGRPPGLKPGTPIDVPVAIALPPLDVPPGGRYEWRLSIDDETRQEWTLPFSTRPAPPGPAAV
ncbi:MAG TPA: hypothetical protein VK915_11215 [Gaiellaceae bacterium]|nr:hypothetical protein [Gaiellaceae bacterium]